ncbi:apolipoprotein D and lipocalin family protein [Fluviicoccus keumensis]|uniref:Outer membrane lipoprotein Blc n=1 Tax=Fluviicoccus keumensis TaxID=1435465 RepID=A0A4Q7Z4R8_9GAMM|nr:lipocalin family protein [Fluviicoccus keumensis]RZU44984.1 apolipoprotein D and lipocalin family protein [Fluviicoccus keumensis]
MKTRLWLGLLLLLSIRTAHAAPVTTVHRVDLNRYLGQWHEIAHLPMFFQRHCLGDTTAVYGLRNDGRISVRNRCRTAKGWQEANGRAKVVPDSGNARLKVSFFWPFSGDYWIVGLDEQYRWAVVGDPKRKYLWILSRTPVLDAIELEKAKALAVAQGYDLSALIRTVNQPEP